MKSGRGLLWGMGGAILVASCGSQNPPSLPDPVFNAQPTCAAQVEPCVGGVALDGTCLGYGPAQTLTVDDKDCVAATQCAASCDSLVKNACAEPQCRIVPSSIVLTKCATAQCGSNSNPPTGHNTPSPGQQVPSDPSAPYRLLSFKFTLSPQFIEQNPPTRDTPISSGLGQPVAFDISGLVGVVTKFPPSFIGYDVSTSPPTFAIPPQSLVDIPTALSLAEPPGLIGNAVVGDVVGVSLYDVSPTVAKRTKKLLLSAPTKALDVDPQFATSTNVALLAGSSTLYVANVSTQQSSLPRVLSGQGVDVTMSSTDAWVAVSPSPGSGSVVRASVPSGTLLGQQSFAGEPVAIGGGSSVESAIPGSIIVLVRTPTRAELHWFLAGAMGPPAIVLPLSDFPNATPVGMKVVVIDNVQYAWVSLVTPTSNVVALYNLGAKAHVKALDVDLNSLEPIAVTAGAPGACNLCPGEESFDATQAAFLHVLVKSN